MRSTMATSLPSTRTVSDNEMSGHCRHHRVLWPVNRMASFSNMMPNPEFYLLGRVPKQKS